MAEPGKNYLRENKKWDDLDGHESQCLDLDIGSLTVPDTPYSEYNDNDRVDHRIVKGWGGSGTRQCPEKVGWVLKPCANRPAERLEPL